MRQEIKNKIITLGIGIILVSLFGLSLAGVLEYYGRMVATINVEGPRFYLDIGKNTSRLNQLPTTDSYLTITGTSSINITSENLGTISFSYIPRCYFEIFANTSHPSATLHLYCYYEDTAGASNEICMTNITISSSTISLYRASCDANQSISNLRRVVLKFEGSGTHTIINVYSNSTHPTYLQITKAP